MILGGVFLMVLGIDWLIHENVYAMVAFLLCAAVLTARALYVPARKLEESDSELLPVCNAIICATFFVRLDGPRASVTCHMRPATASDR